MATKITKTTAKVAAAKYIGTVGRRKTAIASVRLIEGGKDIVVNGKEYSVYFPTKEMHAIVKSPFDTAKLTKKFGVTAKLSGGGIHSQAEALRHGIARALTKYDGELRKPLKVEGFLSRDPRAKERRKFGLKKARKRPQWAKR
ncbi:30S ribosomal protein S9 [bacterium]|nr:30S ribosomal protein S9 [bacterium]